MKADRARSRVLLPKSPNQIARVSGAPRQASDARSRSSASTPPHALARPARDGDRVRGSQATQKKRGLRLTNRRARALFSGLILPAEVIPREKQRRMRKEANRNRPGRHTPAHNSDLWRSLDQNIRLLYGGPCQSACSKRIGL